MKTKFLQMLLVVSFSFLGGAASNWLLSTRMASAAPPDLSGHYTATEFRAQRFIMDDGSAKHASRAGLIPESDLHDGSSDPSAPNLVFLDEDGRIRVRLALHKDGPHLEFYGPDGRRTWFATGGGTQPLVK